MRYSCGVLKVGRWSMFKLVIEDDEGNKTVVPVIRDEISIGRKEGNTIRLTERNVSRRHARLLKEDSDLWVEELSARYGTRKNGERIEGRARFGLGDVFVIGDYRLTLESEKPKAEKPPVASPSASLPSPPKPEERKPNPFSNAPTQITSRDEIEKRASEGTEILPAQPAKIVVISSNFAGQEFPLNRKEMVIGRADECDIIIDHRSVSQTHAKVVREPGGEYKIVDLNSKNGVKVSDEQYRAVHLKRGDVIELGHVRFRFVEPGENYVFSPQAGDGFEATAPKSRAGLGVLAVVLLAVIAVGALYVSGQSDSDATPQTEEPAEAVAAADKETPETAPDPRDTADDSWVDGQLEKAKSQLEEGSPERAIVLLESTRDYPSASTEQRAKIDELLSTARRERPHEKELEQGRAELEKGNGIEALEHLTAIPPSEDSPIYALVEKESLIPKALGAVLDDAQALIEEEEPEKAKTLIDEALLHDASNERALELKDKLEEAERKAVAVARNPRRNTPKRTSAPKVNPDVAMREAQEALIRGDHDAAISKCGGIRNAKCYRILGVAYRSKGDMDNACKYFKRAGTNVADCN